MKPVLNNITFNLSNTAIRRQTLHNKNYIVAPMAMLTAGVHNGSNGPLLYRAAEFKKTTQAWNMKPIVVYHPAINGKGVTACDPDILERQQIGMVMNTTWNGKLRAEAWIDEERANLVDNRVTDALENNKMMELSTGLFTDPEGTGGDWEGKHYDAIAINHQPDHLALLPDKIGACSIADGAGLLQLNEAAETNGLNITGMLANEMDIMRRLVGNAMSHNEVFEALSKALHGKFRDNGSGKDIDLEVDALGHWVVEVFDKDFIYSRENKLYKLGYTKVKNTVTLGDTPEEVTRVTSYKTVESGGFVGNEQTQEKDMKKEMVDTLISNEATQWTEEDRETLTALEETVLNKMNPFAKKDAKKKDLTDEEKAAADKAAADKKKKPVGNEAPAEVPAEMTMNEYIEKAPKEYREVLQNGLNAHKAQKDALIATITANKANDFTAEFLATKEVQELQGLAKLAGGVTDNHRTTVPMMYEGANVPLGTITGNAEVKTLAIPTMNFAEAE